MDLLAGALSAIVFNFFMHQYILIGILTGLTFSGVWVYYSKNVVRKELVSAQLALRFVAYHSKVFVAELRHPRGLILAFFRTLKEVLMQYVQKGLLRLRVRSFLKRSRAIRNRHSLAS